MTRQALPRVELAALVRTAARSLDAIADALEAETETETAPEPRPALLDRADLSRELRISSATLDKLRREPGFPEIRVGDAPRFRLESVLAWLEKRG